MGSFAQYLLYLVHSKSLFKNHVYTAFIKHVVLPLGSLFFRGSYNKHRKQWKAYDQLSSEDHLKLQTERLASIIAYASEYVPFYQNLQLPKDASIGEIPILTKSILREYNDDLISDKFPKSTLQKNHSSGSSGQQSFTYMTPEHTFYLRALQTHWWGWGGYEPGQPILQAGMSLQRSFAKKLKDLFFRVRYMNAFQLTDKNISENLNAISGKQTKHMAGYPSALNEIAKYAIKNKQETPFKSVISYGDKLFDSYRQNFEQAFQNPVIINTYGCAEGYYMACTSDLPYYYIMSPHVYLEVVDDFGMPVPDGEMGHILVTGLTNFAMPLLRYKLGDLGVKLPKEKYPKDRKYNYPLLEKMVGRETDVIKTPNGNTLIVHSFTGILEFYSEIEQFKVIQVNATTIEIQYRSLLELNPGVSSEILTKLTELAENTMEFHLKKVEEITASPSGKPQIMEIRKF